MEAATQLIRSGAVRLLLCNACGIHTVHRRTKSGSYVCWCGCESLPAPELSEQKVGDHE